MPPFSVFQFFFTSILSLLRSRMHWKSILVSALLCALLLQSASQAAEPGSKAPDFSLNNLVGSEVGLMPSASGTLMIIYFFDASDESFEMLRVLYKVASENSDILVLRAISRENPERLNELLTVNKALASGVLNDDKGVTLAYGLSRKLPAAVIVGPGGIVGDVVGPIPSAGDVLMAAADAFISLGFPAAARKIYFSMPPGESNDTELKLGIAYASILAGDKDSALRAVERMAGNTPPLSSEMHAALAFLDYLEGRNDDALAKCARAADSGFARYIEGLVKAASDQCRESAALFEQATKSQFVFKWQKALAFNMAGSVADARGNKDAARDLYKQAFGLSPLNSTAGANLLECHWRRGNMPGAAAYAETLDCIDSGDPLIKALADEFKSETAFGKDTAAQSRLENTLTKGATRKAAGKGNQAETPRSILVTDIAIMSCASEMNFLPVACAGVLKQHLESSGTLVAIKRPEMLFAAQRVGVSGAALENPVRMAEVARRLSAELIAFGEMGHYGGEYVLNLRIADVFSGEVIAIASERFSTLEELIFALKYAAGRLAQEATAYQSNS